MVAIAQATCCEEPAALGRYKVRGDAAATVVGNAWLVSAVETAVPVASRVVMLTVATA